ncbi:MAG TPA: DEAD/DEAH box helicase [Bacilli bacterium]|nr:DEAD/DEAH box helicase [Bacilli bacterium]
MTTETTSFDTYKLPDYLLAALQKTGIASPTPVQEKAIPVVAEGRDLVAQSRTGSGKTLAFLLPQLAKVDPQKKDPQVLILAPTRELASQLDATFKEYGAGGEIRSLALLGGANVERQIERLKKDKPHVLVGTPGRVAELIAKRKLKVHEVKSITVDEVDQMISLGFAGDVEKIISSTLRDRQLLFFSATMSEEAKKFALKWMQHPVLIEAEGGSMLGRIEHVWFGTGKEDKPDTLRRLVRAYDTERGIVFVSDPDRVWWLVHKLRDLGLSAEGMHGEAAKIQREQAMNGFREGKFQLLLTTDLGARGLDVENVTHVFHYDPAPDAEHYVHRAGRTGRGTQSGVSVSIVTPDEKFILQKFEKALGIKILSKGIDQGKIFTKRPGRTVPNGQAAGKKGKSKQKAKSASPNKGKRGGNKRG